MFVIDHPGAKVAALKFSDNMLVGVHEPPAPAAVSITLPPLQMVADVGVTVGVVGLGNSETTVVTNVEHEPLDAVKVYVPACAGVTPVSIDIKEVDEYPLGPVHV